MQLPLRFLLACCLATPLLAVAQSTPSASVVTDGACYELRTYTTHPGRLEALHARFRHHTVRLLQKHKMKLIGFWVPQDPAKGADNTLVYLVEHRSRAAAEASWADFRQDPEWVAARTASEQDGLIVLKVDSVFMNPTDYSEMK